MRLLSGEQRRSGQYVEPHVASKAASQVHEGIWLVISSIEPPDSVTIHAQMGDRRLAMQSNVSGRRWLDKMKSIYHLTRPVLDSETKGKEDLIARGKKSSIETWISSAQMSQVQHSFLVLYYFFFFNPI